MKKRLFLCLCGLSLLFFATSCGKSGSAIQLEYRFVNTMFDTVYYSGNIYSVTNSQIKKDSVFKAIPPAFVDSLSGGIIQQPEINIFSYIKHIDYDKELNFNELIRLYPPDTLIFKDGSRVNYYGISSYSKSPYTHSVTFNEWTGDCGDGGVERVMHYYIDTQDYINAHNNIGN